MDESTANFFLWIATIVIPIIAGAIASKRALRSPDPKSARSMGRSTTLVIGVMLGAVAGFVIDILHPGFIPPATYVSGAVQVLLSGIVGLFVGRVCAQKYTCEFQSPQDEVEQGKASKAPESYDSGYCPECAAKINSDQVICQECNCLLTEYNH